MRREIEKQGGIKLIYDSYGAKMTKHIEKSKVRF